MFAPNVVPGADLVRYAKEVSFQCWANDRQQSGCLSRPHQGILMYHSDCCADTKDGTSVTPVRSPDASIQAWNPMSWSVKTLLAQFPRFSWIYTISKLDRALLSRYDWFCEILVCHAWVNRKSTTSRNPEIWNPEYSNWLEAFHTCSIHTQITTDDIGAPRTYNPSMYVNI